MSLLNEYILSICIPTYHRPEELIKQLSLIGKCWHTLGGKVEVIVTDNSFEGEHSVKIENIKNLNFPVHYYLNEKNIGYQGNILKLLRLARGNYIWFLSDDDFIIDKSIVRILKIIEENPDISYLTFDHDVSINNKVVANGNYFKSLKKEKYFQNGDDFLENYLHSVIFLSINVFSRKLFNDYYKKVSYDVPKNTTYQNSVMLIPFISHSKNILVIPEGLIIESSGDKNPKPIDAIRGNYEYLQLFIQLKMLLKGRSWLKNFEIDFAKNYKLSTLVYTFTNAYTDENFNFSKLYCDSLFNKGCTIKMKILIIKLWIFYKVFSRQPKLLEIIAKLRGQGHAWLYYKEMAQNWIRKVRKSKIHTSYAPD
jgi:hypothetical protein